MRNGDSAPPASTVVGEALPDGWFTEPPRVRHDADEIFAKLMGVFSGLMLNACKKAIAKDLADIKKAAESPSS